MLGVQHAWTAAWWERPEMLAVEQGFFYPARLGTTASPCTGLIDDVVDELIELVIACGWWIALLEDGTLQSGTGWR